jgi:hypothetical protein
MSYSDLVSQITAVDFQPYDKRLNHLLGRLSLEEDTAGRGVLTAIVVHKHDMQPGSGFFEMAAFLGRDTSNHERCWVDELNSVHDIWAPERSRR